MKLYHLSYDTIDCKTDFEGVYEDARNFLLCVLAKTPVDDIMSFNESSLVFFINDDDIPKFFNYLQNNIKRYFYFTISLVAVNTHERFNYMQNNVNHKLNKSLQEEWKSLTCDGLKKKITEY